MDDIIKDFHDLTEIPPFQQMISDKKYMDTEEYLDVLQTLVIALGGGLCVWGGINLLEGYGQDNPAANAHVR